MISVVIKTIQRPNSYLGQTMQNLRRSGLWSSRHLASFEIVDSGSENLDEYLASEVFPYVPVSQDVLVNCAQEKRTLHQTAAEAIREGARRGGDWVLVLEDDLDFCADFLDGVQRWLDKYGRRSIMSVFGTAYDVTKYWTKEHRPYPIENFYGAQALAWSRDNAQQLGEWLGPDPSCGGVKNHGHDLLLQTWARERGVDCFTASVPSFVQHIGRHSGINNKFFEFASWPGREWRFQGGRSTIQVKVSV